MIKIEYVGEFTPRTIPFTIHNFSGGEIHPKLLSPKGTFLKLPEHLVITAHLYSSNDIIELLLVTDALKRKYPNTKLHLICPYLPYARQDRVCEEGESLSLKVLCDIINLQGYSTVVVWDVHSDVSTALLNHVENITAHKFLNEIPRDISKMLFVAPDAGALKKVNSYAKFFKTQVIRADKLRDTETGEIKETIVHSNHVGDKDFLIIDDICDGGRTFIELAKKLRILTKGKVYLYVTHGIFSQGLLPLATGYIDEIFCPHVFPNVPINSIIENNPFLIKL